MYRKLSNSQRVGKRSGHHQRSFHGPKSTHLSTPISNLARSCDTRQAFAQLRSRHHFYSERTSPSWDTFSDTSDLPFKPTIVSRSPELYSKYQITTQSECGAMIKNLLDDNNVVPQMKPKLPILLSTDVRLSFHGRNGMVVQTIDSSEAWIGRRDLAPIDSW